MNKAKRAIIIVVQLFFIAVIVFCGIKIYNWNRENQKNQNILEEVSEAVTVNENNENIIDFEKLKAINSECVGYIKIGGFDIEYPVVQHEDNSYYLTHNFENQYNSAGWIFADYRNKVDGTDKNLIIYGHNRRDGSMFARLRETLNEGWFDTEEKNKIEFITEQEDSTYEIFSVYKIEPEEYYIQTGFTNNSFEEFINTIKNRSIEDFGIEVTTEDQILTLSTCDNNTQYRVVIHAKKIINQDEV